VRCQQVRNGLLALGFLAKPPAVYQDMLGTEKPIDLNRAVLSQMVAEMHRLLRPNGILIQVTDEPPGIISCANFL
jgi:hypothetical protein